MKLPTTLTIGGVCWKIQACRIENGGEFRWDKHTIKINKDYTPARQFEVLIHEVAEVIMTNNMMRYGKCLSGMNANGDYLFSFNHDSFEIFTNELGGIMNELMRR